VRLSQSEIKAIKESFKSIFKTGDIYLFGSRVDDSKRGGDIDLFIVTDKKKSNISKKIEFLVDIKSKIGEQKIDVVFCTDKNRPIEKEALKQGVKL